MGRQHSPHADVDQQARDQEGQKKNESVLPDEKSQREVSQVTHGILRLSHRRRTHIFSPSIAAHKSNSINNLGTICQKTDFPHRRFAIFV